MKNLLIRFGLRFDRNEISGSLGDLGTFLPLVAGLAGRCGLNLGHILFFAGVMNLATGLLFKIPIPVQPMKVIAAVAIAEGLEKDVVIAGGIMAGVIVLLLALTGMIDSINRFVPKVVVRGLQLALGVKLGLKGIQLAISSGNWFAPDSMFTALVCFILILVIFHTRKVLGIPAIFLMGIVLVFVSNPGALDSLRFGWDFPDLIVPSGESFVTGLWRGALPQIPLTILNSVIAVCALSVDLAPHRPLAPRKVAISVGLMNLIACPFGGMPMCHGAGGLAAQYRFGARTGGSMVFLGLAKISLAIIFGGSLLTIIALYPNSVLGVLLIFSGMQLIIVCRDQRTIRDISIMTLIALVCIAAGITAGFFLGLILVFLGRRFVKV